MPTDDDALRERIDHERELREAAFRSHKREHELYQQALELARRLAEENKAAANEWRGAMSDREHSFLSKDEYQRAHEALELRTSMLERADIARSTREQERERAQIRMMALIGLAATVGGFVLSLLVRLLGVGG